MTPLQLASEELRREWGSTNPNKTACERISRAVIAAFLDAAAYDEETAHRVADAHIDAFETLNREHMGRASILALKEAINAPRS